MTRLVLLLGLLAIPACKEFPTEGVCQDPARLDPLPGGILVVAFDSVTMTNTTVGTKIVARQSATVADSINVADANAVWVGRVVGTYTVTVTKSGYQPWSRANVDVNADVCGFIPVQLTVLLQPN